MTFDSEFEPLLDSEEAAALLKIHPKTLQRLARRGEINGVQIGKLWRFRASILNLWLEQKSSTPNASPAILAPAIRVASRKGEK